MYQMTCNHVHGKRTGLGACALGSRRPTCGTRSSASDFVQPKNPRPVIEPRGARDVHPSPLALLLSKPEPQHRNRSASPKYQSTPKYPCSTSAPQSTLAVPQSPQTTLAVPQSPQVPLHTS